ncbi:MAG TPA: ABC-F family ATP-binding cassette domain-containing protein [Actinomycetota bacterium]|nr:ABC-F family ATP-binding cassette domain-containing protein [Actinomycetota bacterium]
MITVTNLWKAFGPQDLFTGADLRVGARERVALVGPNGSGKTTLFEMLAGTESPDRGEIAVLKQADIGYLRQEADLLEGRSLLQEVLSAATEVEETNHKLAVLEAELEECPQGEERDRLLADYAEIHERLADLDGYTKEYEAKAILGGLGFRDAEFDKAVKAFSGGQLMRISLAKLLLAAPDLLMLDEPTNHLDVEAVEWLERFLKAYKGAIFLVSHDREFINGLATRVVEIDGGQLVSYKGDYEAYLAQRELVAEQAEAAERNRARQAAQAQEFIDRFRAKATKARQVQSRIKQVEKMGGPAPKKRVRRTMGLSFPVPPRAGRVIVELKDVTFGYGAPEAALKAPDQLKAPLKAPDHSSPAATPVYEGLDLALERDQKVALVGPNGAGKTTLLKLLAGVLEPQGGERIVGHNAQLAYFSQHTDETLTLTNRLLDEVTAAIPAGSPIRPGDLLGRFLFSGDDMKKRVDVLSGGERTRLAMAKLLVRPLNALFLDEPTNHLDIASRDILEAALTDYQGALVLITHDRHLIREVANRIVEVRDGKVTSYEGDYDFYLSRRQPPPAGSSNGKASRPPSQVPARTQAGATKAAERRKAAAQARAAVKGLRDSLGRIERELEKAAAEMREVSERLADPGIYASGADVAALVAEYETKTKRVRHLEAKWEEAAGLLEAQGASV